MIIKIIGAILIIAASGSFGFLMAAAHRRTAKMMQQLLRAIEYIQRELQYRMSSLSDVFRAVSSQIGGAIGRFFDLLANELDRQIAPDITYCVDAALSQIRDMPELVRNSILLLGKSLGRFDLEGQLKGLTAIYDECSIMLTNYTDHQDVRLRSYQTLALCAGAAVVILFI